MESKNIEKLSCKHMYSWYFTREELEKFSPSRKDGITEIKESEIRLLYCSFIRDVGIKLKIPQMTIATAIMFCHRFYLHQSLAKNGWQTIATVCIFLASKVEDTPYPIDMVTRVAYEMMYRKDPATARKIHQKDVFEKQKALVLIGEKLVLKIIRFDFNIQHPYRPLLDAMKNLGITQKEVKQVAWNFVNDWLKTTLCLQYKPQYIAAGSLYLSSKLRNVKLPLHGAHVWWHQFDVAPKPLEEVIQHMMELVGLKKTLLARPSTAKQKEAPSEAKLLISSSPDSVLNQARSSSSPDIGDPSDHLQVDSNQAMLSRHNGNGENSQPDVNLLNVSAYRNSPCKFHDEESLDQTLITKHSDGLISCSHQISSGKAAAIDSSVSRVKQAISNCNNSSSTLNDESTNQARGSQYSDSGVNSCSEGELLDIDVDSKSMQHVEPPTTNFDHDTACLVVDNLCSDQKLAGAATSTMDNAPCVLPSQVEFDHLGAELKTIDVARVKDLLKKRKRLREKVEDIPSDDLSAEAWIERELESGIVTKQEADHDVMSHNLTDDAWIERELESGIIIGQRNDQVVALDGLSEDDWIERELESGIIVEPGPAYKKQKLESS